MAKPLKILGTIAGAVALVAGVVATAGIGSAAFIVAAGKVATFAGVAATAANIGATLLQKPPPARGSVAEVIVAADPPQPYVMGEGYVGGVIRHDAAWGPTLDKIPNPYRAMAMVLSGSGPVQSLVPYYDQAPVSSWFSGFLWTDSQLGATPEPAALSPQWSGMPGWGAGAKLSGQAAIMWSFLFDKDGKRFASGIGELGGHGQWVKVYDPRKDDTFPGGVGAHRLGDETTYEWSANAALHAGTYAYGRYQNGRRVMGCGLRNIDWANVAAWANLCEANNWTIFGRIFEPGDRWSNLKEIAAAGGAQPMPGTSGRLSFRYSAPTVMLDTIRPDDLTDEPVKVTTMASWAERLNTIIPKGPSEAHQWKNVADGAVSIGSFVAEDGEEKTAEWPFNLVKSSAQRRQLAMYRLWDSRELTPIVVPCGPRLRNYRAGDGLRIELPDYDLSTDAVVLQRRFNPVTLTTYFILISETAAKHALALGQTDEVPPTPALGQTAQERDELAAAVQAPPAGARTLRSRSVDAHLSSDASSISIAAFNASLSDGTVDMAFPAATISGLAGSTIYGVFRNPAAGTYSAQTRPALAQFGDAELVFLGWQATSDGSGNYPPPPTMPGGSGGAGDIYIPPNTSA